MGSEEDPLLRGRLLTSCCVLPHMVGSGSGLSGRESYSVVKAGKSKIAALTFAAGPLPGPQMSVFLQYGRRDESALLGFLYKGMNSIHEDSALMT